MQNKEKLVQQTELHKEWKEKKFQIVNCKTGLKRSWKEDRR